LKEPELEALEIKYNCQLGEIIYRFYTPMNGLALRAVILKNVILGCLKCFFIKESIVFL